MPDDWSTQASAAISLNYQLDFFGRNRASFAAATSRAQAAEAEAAAARLQLSTAVASPTPSSSATPPTASRSKKPRACASAARCWCANACALASRTKARRTRPRAELAQARAELIGAYAGIARTRNQLAALLGKGPDRGLAIEAAGDAAPALDRPAGRVDLDLIGRRPDLVAARLYAEAAAERINVARADFYPNMNIAAVVGLQTLGLGSLGDGSARASRKSAPRSRCRSSTAARIEGAYRGARADYDEAVATYNQSLADALREVADAIGDRRAARSATGRAAQRACGRPKRPTASPRLRYEGGLSSYIDTLSVESSLITQQRARGRTRSPRLRARHRARARAGRRIRRNLILSTTHIFIREILQWLTI